MRLGITGDIARESGLLEIIVAVSGPTEAHFTKKDYGPGSVAIFVVLMCQDPDLKLNRRLRLSRKDNTLYTDVMLDLPTMVSASPKKRRKIVFGRIVGDLTEILDKYKLPDFDRERFLKDLKAWFDRRL
jgi:hypothetical protein